MRRRKNYHNNELETRSRSEIINQISAPSIIIIINIILSIVFDNIL